MNLAVHPFVNGRWRQNAYVVSGDDGRAVFIDPGSDADGLARYVEEHDLKPQGIVNTHGHFDHIGAVQSLRLRYGIRFHLHHADARLVKQANIYKMLFESKVSIEIPEVDDDLAGAGSELAIADFRFLLIPTPGHTPGSMCLRLGDHLFSGDTLLPNGPGRTDLPGGDRNALQASVESLRSLSGDLLVMPGHGRALPLSAIWSRMAEEKTA